MGKLLITVLTIRSIIIIIIIITGSAREAGAAAELAASHKEEKYATIISLQQVEIYLCCSFRLQLHHIACIFTA